MVNFLKTSLLIVSSLAIAKSQIAGSGTKNTGGTKSLGINPNANQPAQTACAKITSSQCPDFEIVASVPQATFDSLVQERVNSLKTELKGTTGLGCATYDTDFSSKARYIKSYACALVASEQTCPGSSKICSSLCSFINTSLESISCVNTLSKNKMINKCNSLGTQFNSCLSLVEKDTCGFEDPTSKAEYCKTTPNAPCCNDGTTPAKTVPTTKSVQTTTKTESKPTTESKETKKSKEKKKGSFFTSKGFLITLGILAAIIGVLGYFYYMGAKDEKEERMRNMESGNLKDDDTYQNNNYGNTQTIEVDKNQTFNNNNQGNNNLDMNSIKSPYDDKPSFAINADPFSDSNQVDPPPYNGGFNSGFNANNNNNEFGNNDYNNFSNDYNDYDKSFNDIKKAGPAENPFDAPEAVIRESDEDRLNKSMQDLSKNFPIDDMPTPSVVKITSIDQPQQAEQGHTDNFTNNNESKGNLDDILKPSMVKMTNIDSPVPSNSVPGNKEISIGEEILKPSMVTLTEIKTPEESKFNNEGNDEKETEKEEPTKGVVNMIDLKTPDSNEALNTKNLLTPSIMITNTEGQTSEAKTSESPAADDQPAQEGEEIQEEFSEMPDPRPFRCIHAYEPQIDDELRLDIDNEIDVLYEYDDGWCWAINKTTGEQGACPMLCLISVQEENKGEREWEKEMDVMKVPGRRESMLSGGFDVNRLSFSKTK